MRPLQTKLIFTAYIFTLAGCATGKIDYDPPIFNSIVEPSIILNKSRDQVWQELIPQLGKHFFVINNIDKESGLINISYSGDPRTYIDCGQITSQVMDSRGKRSYKFKASQASKTYEAVNPNLEVTIIDRKMHLEGRINLILKSLGPTKTRVTTVARYVVTKTWTARLSTGEYYSSGTKQISFNTGQKEKFQDIATTCCANGNLEKAVLSLIREIN